MRSQNTANVARRAKQLYEDKLQGKLESTNMHDYVAIEPDSGDYFFGKTLSEAILSIARGTPRPTRICDASRTRCSR